MRKNIYTLTIALLWAAGFAAAAGAQSIPPSLFSDVKATSVGDIVNIIVNEQSQSQNNAISQSQKGNNLAVTSGKGTGALGFIPGLGVTSTASNAYAANATQTTSDQFTAQVPAVIVRVLENGNFLVRGSREVETNGDKRVTVIEGEIRPTDISSGNTILSSQVANANIYHQGKGITHDGARPGIFVRVLNWIF
jgi:flagellar L-ring protein FlgH